MRNSELWGAGLQWRPLPQAKAPTESADETRRLRRCAKAKGAFIVDRDNVVWQKSIAFSVRIIRLYQHLRKEKHEFVMAMQVLRSGTSVGANISESIRAQSSADFSSKLNIALKEAEETHYWLLLLMETDYISEKQFSSLDQDCEELIRLLTAITKTLSKEKETL